MLDANRLVGRPNLEPRQVVGQRRGEVEEVYGEHGGERLADRAELEQRVLVDGPLAQLGPADAVDEGELVPFIHSDRHPRQPAPLQEIAQPLPVVGGERHVGWTIFFLVIDCDIHPQVGDVEEFLGYVDPAQRE